MRIEIEPSKTKRANAFRLWMKSPMPMVTLVKTIDVSRIRKIAKRKKTSFNMLLCWCIVNAARDVEEFYLLPEKDKLFRYDCLAINVIVKNSAGGINSCDIPFNEDVRVFERDYRRLTDEVYRKNESIFMEDHMIIGTSALVQTEIDCIINQYTEMFCNPMVIWGKYRKRPFKTVLPISFQFHHVQMDGIEAATFLEKLQSTIKSLSI